MSEMVQEDIISNFLERNYLDCFSGQMQWTVTECNKVNRNKLTIMGGRHLISVSNKPCMYGIL